MCCCSLRQNAARVMKNSASEHRFQTCIVVLGTCEMSAPLCKGYWLCQLSTLSWVPAFPEPSLLALPPGVTHISAEGQCVRC